jgi:hypothetical protein
MVELKGLKEAFCPLGAGNDFLVSGFNRGQYFPFIESHLKAQKL